MRLVLDTHVWLDWLVFADPAVRPIFENEAHQIVIDTACEAELHRVLGYDLGNWTLDETQKLACAEACRRRAILVGEENLKIAESRARLPACRDPDDQKFLELALAAGAECLLTRDRALLELAHRVREFRIMAPQALLQPDA